MQVVIVNVGLLLRGFAPSNANATADTVSEPLVSLETLGSIAITASSVCESKTCAFQLSPCRGVKTSAQAKENHVFDTVKEQLAVYSDQQHEPDRPSLA